MQGDILNYQQKNGKIIMTDDTKGDTVIVDKDFKKKVEEAIKKEKESDNK